MKRGLLMAVVLLLGGAALADILVYNVVCKEDLDVEDGVLQTEPKGVLLYHP